MDTTMKKLFVYVMCVAAMLLSACSDDDEKMLEPEYLPVTYAQIEGIWSLAQWNGQPLDDGRYCYLVIGRRADEETGLRPLEIYQNLDSSKSRHLTSDYWLEQDEEDLDETGLTALISGVYRYSAGFWNNTYRISALEADRMTWTVTDDVLDVSLYERCSSVPDDVLQGTRSLDYGF